MNLPAENRDIARNFHVMIDADAPTEHGNVTVNLGLVVHGHAAAERRHVAVDMTVDANAAAKAGRVADFLTGSDNDGVADLREVATLGQRGG